MSSTSNSTSNSVVANKAHAITQAFIKKEKQAVSDVSKLTDNLLGYKKRNNKQSGKKFPAERSDNKPSANNNNASKSVRGSPHSFPFAKSGSRYRVGSRMTHDGTNLIVHRRECLQTLTGSSDFYTTTWDVKPLNTNLFAWGAQIAPLFEKYSLSHFGMTFKTSSGMVTTTQNQGKVYLAMIYDPEDNVFTNVRSMEGYNGCVSSATYRDCHFTMNPHDPLFKSLYIDHGTGYVGLESLGKMVVAVDGQPNSGNMIGEIWIDYTLVLSIPRLNANSTFSTRALRTSGAFVDGWTGFSSGTTLGVYRSTGWPLAVVSLGSTQATRGIYISPNQPGDYILDVKIYSPNNTHGGSLTWSGGAYYNPLNDVTYWPNVSYNKTVGTGTIWQIYYAFRSLEIQDPIHIVPSITVDGGQLLYEVTLTCIGESTQWSGGHVQIPPVLNASKPRPNKEIQELREMLSSLLPPPPSPIRVGRDSFVVNRPPPITIPETKDEVVDVSEPTTPAYVETPVKVNLIPKPSVKNQKH